MYCYLFDYGQAVSSKTYCVLKHYDFDKLVNLGMKEIGERERVKEWNLEVYVCIFKANCHNLSSSLSSFTCEIIFCENWDYTYYMVYMPVIWICYWSNSTSSVDQTDCCCFGFDQPHFSTLISTHTLSTIIGDQRFSSLLPTHRRWPLKSLSTNKITDENVYLEYLTITSTNKSKFQQINKTLA